MTTYVDPDDREQTDRRTNPTLRRIFPEVGEKLHHFFHEHDDWAGSSQDFLALRMVHEMYPDLTTHEVRSLVTAIGRKTNPRAFVNTLTA